MSKLALVTGGSRGLGAHLVLRLWNKGYSVVVVARNINTILGVIEQLPAKNDQIARPVICNLSNSEEVANLIKLIANEYSVLDVLINNAGTQGPIGPLLENNISDWKETIQTNLLAPVELCRGLIPLLQKSKGGSIVNLSGGGATSARENLSAYATSKAALVRFSETLAKELEFARTNIRVNCVAPGPMKTEMLREVLNNRDRVGREEYTLAVKTFESGDDLFSRVGDLVLFLASDKSEGITGRLISAVWDDWSRWPDHLGELSRTDVYTLRRITGRDRGFSWGDK